MAHFIVRAKGRTSEVTRLGTKNSGVSAEVANYFFSLRITLEHIDGKDIYSVAIHNLRTGAITPLTPSSHFPEQ